VPDLVLSADGMPRIPLGDWVDEGLDWVKDHFEPVIDTVSDAIEGAVEGITDLLLLPHPVVFAVLLALLGAVTRSVVFGVGALAGLLLVQSIELWDAAMGTLGLLLVATVVSVAIAVPLGIAAAKNDRVSSLVRPVLDFMQTMPAFAYLVPAVVFFGLGVVPGTITTIIFGLPPGVRLTELGIRQVDRETVEAGHAFGSSPGQILRRIELPLARPTIMAGINQVIMLGLSMAVIAGMIGAGGLGAVVVSAISRLDVGVGFEGGLAVVVLAVYLDRLTASFGAGAGTDRRRGLRTALTRRRQVPLAAVSPEPVATGSPFGSTADH
jgi:glycine betaine/proline transport system permease protein